MKHINWFAVMVIFVFFFGMLGCFAAKNYMPMSYSFWFCIVAGIGYFCTLED